MYESFKDLLEANQYKLDKLIKYRDGYEKKVQEQSLLLESIPDFNSLGVKKEIASTLTPSIKGTVLGLCQHKIITDIATLRGYVSKLRKQIKYLEENRDARDRYG